MANYKMTLVLFLVLVAALSRSYCVAAQINTAGLSEKIRTIMDEKLGLTRMQKHFNSLELSHPDRDPSSKVELLSDQITSTFDTQKNALKRLKDRVEATYRNNNFADRSTTIECCHVNGLSSNYQFVVNISYEKSCDRITQTAEESADSLYSKLDSTYIQNNRAPLKWQYFGSEKGVLNQFPASRTSSCNSTYDHRFRPWYIASATPNPKDIVLVVKNNLFLKKEIQDKQLEATDIILRTLNPKDKLAVILFNSVIVKHPSNSCYGNNLSIATPANIEKFQYFLQTRPDPQSGHNLLGALEAAYKYFKNDRAGNTTRDRGIILFTDGERIESDTERDAIAQLVSQNVDYEVKIFVFAAVKDTIPSPVRIFYTTSIISKALEGGENANAYYIELPAVGDLRRVMSSFYQTFSPSLTDDIDTFNPVFLTPYYDVFGLDQLVLTLATPCYKTDSSGLSLIGVAAVDLTMADLLASVKYFNAGDLSYAFIVDREGLTLYHPHLPVPSTNFTFVYLDISTLEPQVNFSYVRDSMINGGTGCLVLNAIHVLSHGKTFEDGASTFSIPSYYCWRQVTGTPFSVCVVIPLSMNVQTSLSPSTGGLPVSDLYHRIDVPAISQGLDLCQHYGQLSTSSHSAVKFSPESYSEPEKYLLTNETESDAIYLQRVLNDLDDSQSQLLLGNVLGSVSASYLVDDLWSNSSDNFIIWRYISTADGMFRMYPGTYIDIKNFDPLQSPWYQRAITHLGDTVISTVYLKDVLAVTLSQAILSKKNTSGCTVLGVMGADLTWLHIWHILENIVKGCNDTSNYRCMIIDDTGYIVLHPVLFTDTVTQYHLTQLEPFVSQDLLALGYMKRIYCNNFQYNYNFTIHPRRQYSYQISQKAPLNGGHSKFCVFYTIAPILHTNTYVIAVDLARSTKSRCTPITCVCNMDVPCDSLPANCVCPCTEPISSDNYNSCEETFTNLEGPACPVRFGIDTANYQTVSNHRQYQVYTPCFQPNCNGSTLLSCESVAGCKYCPLFDHETQSTYHLCKLYSDCPSTDMPTQNTTLASPATDNGLIVWQTLLGIVLVILSLSLTLTAIFCLHYHKLRKQSSTHSYTISPRRSIHRLNNTKGSVEVIEDNYITTTTTDGLSSTDGILSIITSFDTKSHTSQTNSAQEQLNMTEVKIDDVLINGVGGTPAQYQMGGVDKLPKENMMNKLTNEIAHSQKSTSDTVISEGASSLVGSVSIAGGIWF